MGNFRRRGFRVAASLLNALFFLSACTELYEPQPVATAPLEKTPNVATVPGTNIRMAAAFYNNPHVVHQEFYGDQGLWRGHIAVIQLTIDSEEPNATDLLLDQAFVYLPQTGKYYPRITAKEAFDVAWPAGHPWAGVKEDVMNVGILLFTIATLGVGSVVWVLPSPFQQPVPESTPFGRYLGYRDMAETITLQPGSFRTGFLFFHLPKSVDMNHLQGAQLIVRLVTKKPEPAPHLVTFNLPPTTP